MHLKKNFNCRKIWWGHWRP